MSRLLNRFGDPLDLVGSLGHDAPAFHRQFTRLLRVLRGLPGVLGDGIDARGHLFDGLHHGFRLNALGARPLRHLAGMHRQFVGRFRHTIGIKNHLADDALKAANEFVEAFSAGAHGATAELHSLRQVAIPIHPRKRGLQGIKRHQKTRLEQSGQNAHHDQTNKSVTCYQRHPKRRPRRHRYRHTCRRGDEPDNTQSKKRPHFLSPTRSRSGYFLYVWKQSVSCCCKADYGSGDAIFSGVFVQYEERLPCDGRR